MGGGTQLVNPAHIRRIGLSPRGRGNLRLPVAHRRGAGLSPRGRGNQPWHLPSQRAAGSIPAWAGGPFRVTPPSSINPVYPRVGGGTLAGIINLTTKEGLSPRGRGNRHRTVGGDALVGSIPAWAGEPYTPGRVVNQGKVYPRVGGGTKDFRDRKKERRGLSPRGRGNPAQHQQRGRD